MINTVINTVILNVFSVYQGRDDELRSGSLFSSYMAFLVLYSDEWGG